jgi:hypothetical protein
VTGRRTNRQWQLDRSGVRGAVARKEAGSEQATQRTADESECAGRLGACVLPALRVERQRRCLDTGRYHGEYGHGQS